jgi:hypothetical protein
VANALLPLMGVVGYVGAHHFWLWLGRRAEALHLWVAAWCDLVLGEIARAAAQVMAVPVASGGVL